MEAALGRADPHALRRERLWTLPARTFEPLVKPRPYYETYGERQVAAGRYQQVLRLEEHVLPLARALADARF